MSLFQWLKNVCAAGQLPAAHIPDDPDAPPVRRRFHFFGLVQCVGFRYEAYRIASRLGLVGWAQNLDDGSVVVEIEGNADRIEAFLLEMKAVPRFDITDIRTKDLPPSRTETAFKPLY